MFNIKMGRVLQLGLLLSFISHTSFAQSILLVSDIDDTIKRTGIHSHSVGLNAPATINDFAGMSQLYNRWYRQNQSYGDIFYLTAAPVLLDTLGIDFLRESQFPPERKNIPNHVISGRGIAPNSAGSILPELEDSGEFKKRKLIELYESIKSTKPSVMVLVGDNGEKDVLAYQGFMEYLKQMGEKTQLYIYIHHVYEKPGKHLEIQPGQIEFLTAADLAVHFANNGWINSEQLAEIFREIAFDSNPDNDFVETVIPEFMECQNYLNWPQLKNTNPDLQSSYVLIQNQMKTNCGTNQ